MSNGIKYALMVSYHEYGGDRSIPRTKIYELSGNESIAESYAAVEAAMSNMHVLNFTIEIQTISQLNKGADSD